MSERPPTPPRLPWLRLALLTLATLPVLLFGLVVVGFRDDSKISAGGFWTLVAILWVLQGTIAYLILRRSTLPARRSALIAAALFPVTYITLVIAFFVAVSI
jgi:hypothetical protein